MRLFLCYGGIPVPLAGYKITGGIKAVVDDGAIARIFYDGRLVTGFIPVVAHIVKLVGGKRKPQADFEAAFFQQGRAYLYGDAPTETYTELNSFYLLVDRPAVYGLPDKPVNPWVHMAGDYARTVAAGVVGLAALVAALMLT